MGLFATQRCDKKSVWITGASSGIGEALAHEFAKRGARVVLTGRRMDRLQTLAQQINNNGGTALALELDVTLDGQCESVVHQIIQQFGGLDVVIANAGFGVMGNVSRLQLEDYRRQFETNIFGVLRTIQAGIPEVKKTKGSLVLVGSVMGHLSLPGGSPYAMSKFAVRALADSLHGEMRPHGVGVTLISPGFVRSEIHQVDNQGVHHPGASKPLPAWVYMDTDTAARQMVDAILSRRAESIITFHGKVAIFLKQHFDGLVRWIISRSVKARQPASSN